jgi:uncharacterized phage-associated protein
MSWYFDPQRATQAAAFLVNCSGAKEMQYLKLLKLLYFADRESIKENGYPITGDQAYAMKHGPVLTTVYDFISADEWVDHAVWDESFSTEPEYMVRLKKDPGTGKLSRGDKRILRAVYALHKDLDGFEVSELTHLLPEFVTTNKRRIDSNRGSEIIPIEETLKALGFSQEEIAVAKEKMDEDRSHFRFFEGKTVAFSDSCG